MLGLYYIYVNGAVRILAGYKRNIKGNTWRLEYQFDGEKYSKNVTAKSLREADKLLALFVAEIENGNFEKKNTIRFTNFAQTWLDEYARPNLKQNTVDIYKLMLNSKILPEIGNYYISKINKQSLTSFYNTLKENYNLSTKTIKNYHGLISSILQLAVDWDYLKSNPCSHLKLPKNEKNIDVKKFLTQKELSIFLHYLDKETDYEFKTIIYLIVYTGLRKSEALGLTWKDVQFDEGYIYIRQSKVTTSSGELVSITKNTSSTRIVQVPQKIMDMLKKLERKDEFVFNFKSRTLGKKFKKFINYYKCIPAITLHKLRHTHATLLISNNIDIKSISARLGHSETSTTLNIYSHVLQENDKKIAKMLNNL